MAPRASWKGYLKLSLVSCPVRLYPATSTSERISFNQLHKKTHNRINMKPVDPELGLVERADLIKGYEYEDKQYVIIEESDLESVRIESNHTMNIEAFVDEGEVDVIYQDTPYYLAPDGAMAEETFAVLREAMRKSGKLAIARLVLSSRERVITIGARENGMFVCTLRNPNEVRSTAEYFGNIPVGKPDPEMLQLAEALIQQKVTKFDPKNYEDRYEIALMAMIKEKLKGHKPILAAAPERGNVINLMDALKASLGQTKPPAKSKTKTEVQAAPAKAAAVGRQVIRQREEVTALSGKTLGLIGSLAAFPRRLAVREVERQGGELLRGVTRRATHIVFGRTLLAKLSEAEIAAQFQDCAKSGRPLLSENGFLRLLGVLEPQSTSGLTRQSILEQSKLTSRDFELLCLFDAFEHDSEPFSFRDVILARKYATLLAGGTTWHTIAKSVRRSDKVASLTALSLQADRNDGDLCRQRRRYAGVGRSGHPAAGSRSGCRARPSFRARGVSRGRWPSP